MADKAYHQRYWQAYKKRAKRVSVTLDPAEYRDWKKKADAAGVTVGQQIKQEALAYRRGEYLPTAGIALRLDEITRVLRGIGNNINQLAAHSNRFRRILDEREVLKLLQRLEREVDQLVRQAWKPPEQE